MQITLIQALLIGLWTAFCYAGMLWGIYTNRALVLSFGVGVILNDIPTALACGAVAELASWALGSVLVVPSRLTQLALGSLGL